MGEGVADMIVSALMAGAAAGVTGKLEVGVTRHWPHCETLGVARLWPPFENKRAAHFDPGVPHASVFEVACGIAGKWRPKARHSQ
jgi:hypothetical protein